MTPENEITAPPPEKKSKPQRHRAKPQGQGHTEVKRGLVLALLDFHNGNLGKTAMLTGVSSQLIKKWRDETDPDYAESVRHHVRTQSVERMIETLLEFVMSLCTIALLKADMASFRDLYCMMGVMLDKVVFLQSILQTGKAPTGSLNLRPSLTSLSAGPEPAIPVEPEAPVVPKPSAEDKKYWENMVNKIMADAEEKGKPLTRSEVIESLIAERPACKQFLGDEPTERLM